MHLKMHNAPRCQARSKRSGQQCKAPAVRGKKVCRMHGARSGAPRGKRHGNYKHGIYTKEWQELRREALQLARIAKAWEPVDGK